MKKAECAAGSPPWISPSGEMTLYLDTHAEDTRAMKTLEQLRNRRAELIGEYEMRFGPYVVTSNDVTGTR